MDALTVAAASGLRARMESLDMLANNLANASSAGFKADREFYSLYAAPEAFDPLTGAAPATLPVIERHWTDFAPGAAVATGKPLDLAISGSGFFRVAGPAGPLYTRNGNFRLAPDGRVTTAEGYPVAARDGGPVRLDAAAPWEIDAQGEIRQGGNVVAALALVDFEQPGALAKAGSTYFSWNGDPAQGARAAAGATVEQGRLEGANFSPAESAVRLVSVLRQFEALNRALALGGEMSRRAIEEVAKVNP